MAILPTSKSLLANSYESRVALESYSIARTSDKDRGFAIGTKAGFFVFRYESEQRNRRPEGQRETFSEIRCIGTTDLQLEGQQARFM